MAAPATDPSSWMTFLLPIVKAVPALSTLITVGAGIAPFYWSNLRSNAKRVAVIDMATRRVAFWDQFLKTALAATNADSDEQKASKFQAYTAIERIRLEANHELARLSWGAKIKKVARKQVQKQSLPKLFITFSPHQSLNGSKFEW